VAEQYGYSPRYRPIGQEDAEVGAPSQMAVFEKLPVTEIGAAHKARIAAATAIFDKLPSVESLLQGRKLDTDLVPNIFFRSANACKAFEKLNSYGVDPRWLIYVPPTMSPCSTSVEPGTLEYPDEAFDHYQKRGVREVVCEQKHMGSRAVVIVCRTPEAAAKRFGIESPAGGACYTRMGRPFFTNDKLEAEFLASIRLSLTRCGFWDGFSTDWVALDCELMPWSAKAQDLIRWQYADVGAAALASLPAAVADMELVQGRGQDVGYMVEQLKARLKCAELFRAAYRHYCWPVSSLADYRLAPFHIMATEGAVHTDRDHVWHMETIKTVAMASDGLIIATPYRVVDLTSDEERKAAIAWWEELTGAGGEGMVVKPLTFMAFNDQGLLQPAIKCRGREYLRIIYGPDYNLPHHLDRLRERGLNTKRALALREFALGVESLERFVRGDSLASVHECAFAVLALETEVCDPRL
jgi:protein phosphatase